MLQLQLCSNKRITYLILSVLIIQTLRANLSLMPGPADKGTVRRAFLMGRMISLHSEDSISNNYWALIMLVMKKFKY